MADRWNYVADSVVGESHVRLGLPCQDAHQVGVLHGRDGDVLIIACADGAGSASRSQDGARLACSAILRYAEEYLANDGVVRDLSRESAAQWLSQVTAEVAGAAIEAELTPRDFACTLLVVLVSSDSMFAMQIGDGAIVYTEGDEVRTAFWPDSGEYANTTTFITSDNAEARLHFSAIEQAVREVAVLTDGLQLLALDFAAKRPHAPFFRPMFIQLANTDDPSLLNVPLRSFLTSEAVNLRTDDDKTLVVAVHTAGTPQA